MQLVVDAIHESAKFARAGWVAQFTQSLRFDLADTLASNGERLSYFF
jgi:hypothetical protein